MDAEIEGKKVADDKKKYLSDAFEKSKQEIERLTDIGSFLIADDAVTALKEFSKRLDSSRNANSFFEYLDASWGLTNKCLDTIRVIAKNDLGTRNENRSKWFSI